MFMILFWECEVDVDQVETQNIKWSVNHLLHLSQQQLIQKVKHYEEECETGRAIALTCFSGSLSYQVYCWLYWNGQ